MSPRHVWSEELWKTISLGDFRSRFLERAKDSPRLGEISVRDLCCLARADQSPVGIYVFSKGDEILYAGKTHGRSFHERMVSHLDHRDPVAGSPHLAQFAQSMVKRGEAESAEDAVSQIMDMKITWLPISNKGLTKEQHKRNIALVERRLLWKLCLDPKYNSPRVKRNNTFRLKGEIQILNESMEAYGNESNSN